MRVTSIIISILIVSGVMLGISAFYGDMLSTYNPSNATSTAEFEKFNESFSQINTELDSLEKKTARIADKGFTDLTLYTDAVMAFVDVGGILVKLPKMALIFTSQMLNFLPYTPPWFILVVGTTLTLIFLMKVVSIFTKTEEI